MNLLIAIIPAFLWGISPVITTKIGGTAADQVVGACYGEFTMGLVILFLYRPSISYEDFKWCFFAGLAWTFGQLMQFQSFKVLNVSRAMSVSTGMQLILAPLAGVIFWHEWNTTHDQLLGWFSILLLIIGITLTSIHQEKSKKQLNYRQGLPLLIFSGFLFTVVNIFPKIPNANGIIGTFPQTLGDMVSALIVAIFVSVKHHHQIMFKRVTVDNMIFGLLDAFGTIFYITSLKLNGAANAFPLTQLDVVVSSLGGILLLHEHKNKKEMVFTLIGLFIIISAAFMIASLS